MRIAITIKGTEDLVSKDLNGEKILPARIKYNDSSNIQGVNTIYSLIKQFKFISLEDIKTEVSKLDFNIEDSFRVLCNREGSHNFKSITAEQEIGEIIYNKCFKVNLKEPKTIIFLDIIDNNCLIGYLEKHNLYKRPYRFKTHHKSINPLLAYSMIKFSSISKEHSLLDPFCKDSVIPIEASICGIKSIHAYDILKNNIYNSSINIKLAKAQINLKHYNMNELSSLIKDIDYIITTIPSPSKNQRTSYLTPLLKEFFTQSHKILKKSLVLATTKPSLTLNLSKDLFKLESSFTSSIGNINYTIFKMLPC